jgi:hypothetical protein
MQVLFSKILPNATSIYARPRPASYPALLNWCLTNQGYSFKIA